MTKLAELYQRMGQGITDKIDVVYNKNAGAVVNKIATLDTVDKHLQELREALVWELNDKKHNGAKKSY